MSHVSVIIPTYNCARYISEAIESALGQSHGDFEIIVVDDGSTDDTPEVLKKYGNQIKYIYQKNGGVSAARNRGIVESQGKYVAFLDADDIWLPDKISVQVEIMDANPELAVVFTDGVRFDETGITRNSLKPGDWRSVSNDPDGFWRKIGEARVDDGSIFKGDFYKDLLAGNLVFFTSSVLIRKECFKEVGLLEEKLSSSEDYNLWLRMSHKHPFLYLNKVTSKYRERMDSICGDKDMRVYFYKKWDGIMFDAFAQSCPPDDRRFFTTKACDAYQIAIWGYFRHGEMDNVRMLCYKFLCHNKKCLKIYVYILMSFLPFKRMASTR